jgi:hypothetical protein
MGLSAGAGRTLNDADGLPGLMQERPMVPARTESWLATPSPITDAPAAGESNRGRRRSLAPRLGRRVLSRRGPEVRPRVAMSQQRSQRQARRRARAGRWRREDSGCGRERWDDRAALRPPSSLDQGQAHEARPERGYDEPAAALREESTLRADRSVSYELRLREWDPHDREYAQTRRPVTDAGSSDLDQNRWPPFVLPPRRPLRKAGVVPWRGDLHLYRSLVGKPVPVRCCRPRALWCLNEQPEGVRP